MLEKTIYYQLARKVNSIEGNIPSTKIEDFTLNTKVKDIENKYQIVLNYDYDTKTAENEKNLNVTNLIKRVDFETKLRNISNRSASNKKKNN